MPNAEGVSAGSRWIVASARPGRIAAQRSHPALSKTCNPEKSSKTALLNRKRAQRIPSWPGALCSNKGRIHLRRPTCHFHFSLATRRRTIPSGLPTTHPELTGVLRSPILNRCRRTPHSTPYSSRVRPASRDQGHGSFPEFQFQ